MSNIIDHLIDFCVSGQLTDDNRDELAKILYDMQRQERLGQECLERIAKAYLDALEKIAADTKAEFGEYARHVALCAMRDGHNIREHFLNEMRIK